MSTTILDGKLIAAKVNKEASDGVRELVARFGECARPRIGLVLVGDDPVSKKLVGMKKRDHEAAGMNADIVEISADTSEEELIKRVAELDADPSYTALLVQLPLPSGFDKKRVLAAISKQKDADGLSCEIGCDIDDIPACTPAGIIRLLEEYGVEISGSEAVVIGRSALVGRPMAIQLMLRGATVTVCHTKTRDLKKHTKRADILICAAGSPHLVTADMIKKGAAVVDVGATYTDEGLVGDVDFEDVVGKAGFLTPNPGGVGPMTRAMLVMNTFEIAKRKLLRPCGAER